VFERFTDRARKTILEAQAEAVEQQVNFIGTEHLLLGLLRIGDGAAHQLLTAEGAELEPVREKVLTELGEIVDPTRASLSTSDALAAIGIDLGSVKASVESAFGPGSLPDPGSTPAFTPRAKAALEGGYHRAQRLRQRYVGTEHVLLGLLVDRETFACNALAALGVDLDRLERRTLELTAPAEARVDEAWKAITELQMRAGQLPEDQRADAVAALAALGNAVGRALGDEQAAVTRAAEQAAGALEAALATARAALGGPATQ
jgi:ATP-dependent Clp protease ATP-binding subunit ClpC